MRGLERSSDDAERKRQSDVKQSEDMKPPKEIGESSGRMQEYPYEINEKDNPDESILGGSYRDCKRGSDGSIQEVHHIPSKEASPLSEGDGPCIIMEKEDHRQTASCGSSKEAREYRAKQKELIDQGKFREAFEMDKRDIQSKFGDKYDKSLSQAEAYLSKLEQGGILK